MKIKEKEKGQLLKKVTGRILILFVIGCLIFSAFPQKSNAACCPCTSCTACVDPQTAITMQYIVTQHMITRLFITQQFRLHQSWLFGSGIFAGGGRDSFFELHMLPALMMMTEQLVTTGMEQMLIVGTFFDAKIQMETQQLFQKKVAQAHKDYQPSFDMCVIGTTARGLASADRNGEFTNYVLSQRSQDRQIGIFSSNAAKEASFEREGRIKQVKARYCDPRDNSNNLAELCTAGKTDDTVNIDIDYTRLIDMPRTLNIDFTNPTNTADEIDVMALASNLFSNRTLTKPTKTPSNLEEAEGAYMAMRSLIAKRSVVENSFNAIVGMKSSGTINSEPTITFAEKFLEQFGITDPNERKILLGGTVDSRDTAHIRPSYYAMLEVLAQKIYQSPEFFTNLYDKPANVARKSVAMQAVNLMLERDMHKSELRSEMDLAVWLELELIKYQDNIQNRLNAIEEKYEED